jgi:hypothetical protein
LCPIIGSITLHKSKRCDTITHNVQDMQSKQPVGSAGQGNTPDAGDDGAAVILDTIATMNLQTLANHIVPKECSHRLIAV